MGEQAGELAGEMGELAGEGLRLCPRVGAKCVWGKEWGAWHLGKMGKMEKKIKKIYKKKNAALTLFSFCSRSTCRSSASLT